MPSNWLFFTGFRFLLPCTTVQWPGSYCDTKQSCCYPTTGKPKTDFGIHGLWSSYNDGSYLSNCNPNSPYVQSKISDLIRRMQVDQHWPAQAAMILRFGHMNGRNMTSSKFLKVHVTLHIWIHPDGSSYSLSRISDAIKGAVGYAPGVECNVDASGNCQLYQIYLCVDTSGSNLIKCPVLQKGGCASNIDFPTF
ncbi:hypothetical protein CMV_004655 [Castanea mollissima]|uniref:Uncharacterized protein n=1 Tax=Castanea mollissima TaxID=60419 RepID=A0A8J4RLG5_9ROSI|nr:hypothetical protein CMV_004655 [Castanea mollissima]